MTSFENGPAHGATLNLRRSPLFLRVVIDGAGKIDALDLLDDEPAAGETIHVYRLKPGSTPGSGFVCTRSGPGKGCNVLAFADYVYVDPQPRGEELREAESWRQWCREQLPDAERLHYQ